MWSASAFADFEYTPELRYINEVMRHIENPVQNLVDGMVIAAQMRESIVREEEDENTYGFLKGYQPMSMKKTEQPKPRKVSYEPEEDTAIKPEGELKFNAQWASPGLEDPQNPPEGFSALLKFNKEWVSLPDKLD